MKFRLKLIYCPEEGESLSDMLSKHKKVIHVEERYEKGDLHIAVCISKSLAKCLQISADIGTEVEILYRPEDV